MPQYLIMCRSLTYAQRAARTLERRGFTASVAKAPQGVSGEGCSYGVRVRQARAAEAIKILKEAGFEIGKVLLLQNDGSAKEAAL